MRLIQALSAPLIILVLGVSNPYVNCAALEVDGPSLHEVIENAWQHNPRRNLAPAYLKHQDAMEKTANSLWSADPTFIVNHYNDELADSDGLLEWEVGVQLPLWLPGQKQTLKRVIDRHRTKIGVSEQAQRLEMAGTVREILWAIAVARNQVELAKVEWDTLKSVTASIRRRVSLGDLAESDHLLAEQELLAKEAQYHEATSELNHAEHLYNLLTGLHEIPGDFTEAAPQNRELPGNHPLLDEANLVVEINDAQFQQSKRHSRSNPTLFLGSRHERGTSQGDFTNALGLSINVPLGLSSHNEHKVTANAVQLAETQSQRDTIARELRIEMHEAEKEFEAAERQLEYAKQRYALAMKMAHLNERAFELGEISFNEFIRVQSKTFAAERNFRQKGLEVDYRIARLNQALGIVP